MRKPRVFIGFGETSGYCAGLKRGFDEIGIPAVSFMITEHRSQYEQASGRLLSAIRSILKKREALQTRRKQSSNLLAKLAFALGRLGLSAVQNAVWLAVLVWALAKFDVFVLQGRTSFIQVFRVPIKPRFLDLALLKLLGKKIIYVFHGTDTRPAYLNGAAGVRKLDPRAMIRYARRQARDVRTIERYADAILHYPLNSHFHRRKIVSHEFIGRPVFVGPGGETKPAPSASGVRIVHAPTDPIGKGSEKIRECVERLRQKGHPIEFIQLIDKTNDEVKEQIRQCDFLVDQAYYDVAISYVGTEAAFLGKPSVCGTYAMGALDQATPEGHLPPVRRCWPQDLEATIEQMIQDGGSRQGLGRRAREFVESHYGPKNVARNYLRVIENDVPAEWFFDPNSLDYCHGYGYAEEKAREVLRGIVQAGGESALSMDHKPTLKQKLLRFAFEGRAA